MHVCVCITKVEEEVMNLRRWSTGSIGGRKGRDGNDVTTVLMYGILKYIFQANTKIVIKQGLGIQFSDEAFP